MGVEMEAVRLLVAQGRYHEVNGQVWSSLTRSQRQAILDLLPLTKQFDLYVKLCPDPRQHQDWYLDWAIKMANLVGPAEAIKLITFAYQSNNSPSLKKTLDDLLIYSKLQALLSSTYKSLSSQREMKHITEIMDQLRFPINLSELNIEPWLCTALMTVDLGADINSQLSSKLLTVNPVDSLYSLSELNFRQVNLSLEPVERAIDMQALLSSIKSHNGLSAAKAILGPAGFDIDTTQDLKEALGAIIRDNQALAVSAADELCDWSLLEPTIRSNITGVSSVNLQLAFECLSLL